MIAAFNAAMKAKPELEKKQTEVGKILDEAKKTHDTMAMLKAEHEIKTIQFGLEELSSKASGLRKELRDVLLKGVPAENGKMTFYAVGASTGRGKG